MNRILALIWKELLTVLYDQKIRLSILMPPILQLFVFAFAATLDVKNAPVGILNRDSGAQGFELVERFRGSPVFRHNLSFLEAVEEVKPFIDLQKGIMVLSIDQEFSRKIDAGLPATVQVILDGRKTNTTQILAGYTQEIIQEFNQDLAAQENIQFQKSELIQRTWFNPNRIYFWYNIPCLVAIISMLTCLVVTTQSIARERELGTFDQLLVSPLRPVEILIGKVIPGIIIGLAEGMFMLTLGTLVLGVPFNGSFPIYFLSLLIFVSAISGVGLFISSLSATQQQAMLGTFIFMLPTVLLSGYATPIENMPEWLQPFSYMIPLTYMMIISKGIFLKGISASIVFENLWPLMVISVLSLVGAGIFFKRRLE